ncbi:MAG TPA: transcription termination factor Rho [Opitutaceae bacterium]
MSIPPKSDDETPAPEDGAKPRRGRPRARKTEAGTEAREEPKAEVFTPEPRPEAARSPEPQADRAQDSQPQGGGQQQGGYDDRQGGDGRHGHGGHGEWQDRNSWKRNKRKRGRHGGGQWQGGQGGGQSRFPQQPPPPSSAPVQGDLPSPDRFADLAALDALAKEIASSKGEPVYLDHIYSLNLADLGAYAKEMKVEHEGVPNRIQLLKGIFDKATDEKRPIADRGYIDLNDHGAFIVHEHVNYRLYPEDAYLPESLIRRYGLKRGHHVEVRIQPPQGADRCPAVIRIDKVMGGDPDDISKVTPFEELIPYYPLKRILLEDPDIQKDVSMRAVDILTPIGFVQRGLIVAPPRTGKTILLQNIANSVSENSPFAKLILLLVDERPEEVTDFRRHTKGEVVSSTFDEAPESHVHCAEMVGEKARRLVEQGEHVVILLDSITRLARAYNALASSSGKIMSGGLESNALQRPKRFFGAARNIEGAGSLTIIATALVDTGSRADEIIFEEFKGTGNMELHLDRGLVERRIFPAINIDRSGTRKEELIYHPEELQRIYGLRRAMQGLGPIESMEMLIQRLKKTKSNAEFLLSLSRQ